LIGTIPILHAAAICGLLSNMSSSDISIDTLPRCGLAASLRVRASGVQTLAAAAAASTLSPSSAVRALSLRLPIGGRA